MEKCLPLVLVQDQRGAPYILQLMRFFNVSLWTRNNSFLQVIHSNPMHSSYMLSKACSVFRFEITELTKQGLSGQMSIVIMSASTGFHWKLFQTHQTPPSTCGTYRSNTFLILIQGRVVRNACKIQVGFFQSFTVDLERFFSSGHSL